MKKIRVVDFFCGCGGTSAGMELAGMEILAGIDIDLDAGATYKQNFPKAKFIQSDIRTLRPEDLDAVVPKAREFPLLISTCAPCQPFTKQNTTKKENDSRKGLLDELHRFIEEWKPEYIFLENVPGLQKIQRSGGPLTEFLNLLDQQGYSYSSQVVNAKDYGVPQHRRRFVLIASLIGELSLPTPVFGPEHDRPHTTVWDNIKDLPALQAGESNDSIPNHRAAKLSELNIKRITATPVGGSRNDWPEHLTLECHKKHNGHSDVYGRMKKDAPATALTTRCISLSNGRYGHPTQNRAISAREAARIQTFPDNFIFSGGLTSAAKQIGNAVPVILAKEFGKNYIKHYRSTLG